MPGKLCSKSGLQGFDCTIADMSRLGARVRVRNGTTIPAEVFLVHMSEWTAYDARIVWRRADGNVGLAFKRSYDLEGALRPDLRVLREFCASYERNR